MTEDIKGIAVRVKDGETVYESGEPQTDAVKTVCCASCHEWYDARSPACYLCGEARPDYNAALANAVATERMNGALMKQNSFAAAERQVGSQIPASPRGAAPSDRLYNLPYAKSLAANIKAKLQDGGAFG